MRNSMQQLLPYRPARHPQQHCMIIHTRVLHISATRMEWRFTIALLEVGTNESGRINRAACSSYLFSVRRCRVPRHARTAVCAVVTLSKATISASACLSHCAFVCCPTLRHASVFISCGEVYLQHHSRGCVHSTTGACTINGCIQCALYIRDSDS